MKHTDDQHRGPDTSEIEQSDAGRRPERSLTLKFSGAVTGTLVGVKPGHPPIIDFPGNPTLAHLAARVCVQLAPPDVGKEVVLLFEDGDPSRPIIIGLIQPQARDAGRTVSGGAQQEVELDGKRIEFSASETITLRCGDASITLNSDGKIVIRGMHVISHAAGVNRIRGGSVQLN